MTEPKTYRKRPVEIRALQFTGDNWAEMHAFTGHHLDPIVGTPVDTFAPAHPNDRSATAVLFVADGAWVGVQTWDWIVEIAPGLFERVADLMFRQTYEEVR